MSARLAPLCLMLCLAACGSSPKTRFYALEPLPSTQSPSVRAPTAPVVVDHVELPSMLDRLSLVTEGPGNQISVSDTERWAAPLDEQVRRTLTADLQQHLSAGSVLAAGDPAPAGTRTITLNVQQFIADASGQVSLEADWSLHAKNTTSSVRRVSIHVASQGQGGDAIAASMSRALAQLADRMSAEL